MVFIDFLKLLNFVRKYKDSGISILHIYKVVSIPVVLTGIVFMTKYGRIGFKFIALVPLKYWLTVIYWYFS